MSKLFAIRIKEQGRGEGSLRKFATLEEATKVVKDYWRGADYVDGPDGFHTDYSTVELIGFALKEIGQFCITDDGCREFRFNEPIASPDDECEYPQTRDDMVRAGLMESHNYRDFATKDCFPEDWTEDEIRHGYHLHDGADKGL